MRILVILLLASVTSVASVAFAQEPTIAVLKAEIESLKAQLARAQMQVEIEKLIAQRRTEIAALPDVMKVTAAAADAAAKLEAARKPEPPKPEAK